MKKLLKSKKGQLPVTDVFSNIVNGIRSLITWLIAVMQKPLLAIIFLMFIVLLGGFLIPLFLNGVGYHCDTNGQVWKVSTLSIFYNFDLLREKPSFTETGVTIPLACGGSGITNNLVALCTNCTRNDTVGGSYGCVTDGHRLANYTFLERFTCEGLIRSRHH